MNAIELTKKQKLHLWLSLDIIATYIIPFSILAFEFELFGGVHTDTTVKGLGWAYIFGLLIVGGIFWRIRQVIKLSGKKGWQFALAKSTSPLFFLFFWYMLGLAEGNIDKLQVFSLVTVVSHSAAIFFRYKAGKNIE